MGAKDSNEWAQWREHPMTEAFFEELKTLKQVEIENVPFKRDNMEETFALIAERKGAIETYTEIIETYWRA